MLLVDDLKFLTKQLAKEGKSNWQVCLYKYDSGKRIELCAVAPDCTDSKVIYEFKSTKVTVNNGPDNI